MPGRVLVTGAAGLLGGEISGRLADRGAAVTALVHRSDEVLRNDGRAAPVTQKVRADITRPGLGLEPAARARLAAATDLVIHCAAATNFTPETDRHRAVNVEGTRHALAFADEAGARFVHVSTAYVCGDRDGLVREDELEAGQRFHNGYEATKFRAEELVRQSDVPWTIARPGIVLGDHASGRIRSFETIYPVLKVMAEGWISTMPAAPGASLDLVPIDHVCGAIVLLAERFGEASGRAFHLTGRAPTPLSAFPETLGRFEGLAVPRWVAPEAFEPAALPARERRFFRRGAEAYAPYFARNPRFEAKNLGELAGITCPPTDEAWWYRLVAFAIEAGFITPQARRRA